jgi:hypothetical protein
MLHSQTLANPFEGHNAHFLRIDDVNQALIELETQEETAGDTSGVSSMPVTHAIPMHRASWGSLLCFDRLAAHSLKTGEASSAQRSP